MKAISKVVAVAAASMLALSMVGCGGEKVSTNPDEAKVYTAEEASAQDITVTKSGYSIVEAPTIDSEGNETTAPQVDFAFVVNNPNSGYVAQNVPFNITGYNSNGETVFSGGATCMYLYPGIDTAISGSTTISDVEDLDTTIETFSVEPILSTVEYLKTGLTNDQIANMFDVNNLNVTETEGVINISASVTGDLADGDKIFKVADLEGTLEGHAVVIFFDGEGNIIYGSDSTNILIDQTTLDMQKDAETQLDNVSLSLTGMPAYGSYQMYVMPGL